MRTDLKTTQAIIVASPFLHNIAVKTRIDIENMIEAHNIHNIDINNIVPPKDGDNQAMLSCLKQKEIIREYF